MRMVTADPSVALQLDALSIAFSDPLSERAVSEIFPTQVLPGEETEFRFFLRPRETKASGFDRLVLETPTPTRFIAPWVNDTPLEVTDQPVEAGFAVTFPQPLRDGRYSRIALRRTGFSAVHPLRPFYSRRSHRRLQPPARRSRGCYRSSRQQHQRRRPARRPRPSAQRRLRHGGADAQRRRHKRCARRPRRRDQHPRTAPLAPAALRLGPATRSSSARKPSLRVLSTSLGMAATKQGTWSRPASTCSNSTLMEMLTSSACGAWLQWSIEALRLVRAA